MTRPARAGTLAAAAGQGVPTSGSLRVLVVNDQTLVRQGICSLLALSAEIDVVLLDLRMPGRDVEAMAQRGIDVPVLVVTTFDDDELVMGALRPGAKGYLLKDVTLDQLVEGVRSVATGAMLLRPALSDRLLHAVAKAPRRPDPHLPEPLTPRELDVLRLAAAGLSNWQIAQALHLAKGTVKNHTSSILPKLGVNDRTKAVLRALESGILTTAPADPWPVPQVTGPEVTPGPRENSRSRPNFMGTTTRRAS